MKQLNLKAYYTFGLTLLQFMALLAIAGLVVTGIYQFLVS